MHCQNHQTARVAIGRVLQPFTRNVASFLRALFASRALLTGSILAPLFESEAAATLELQHTRLEVLCFEQSSTPLVNILWAEGYRPGGLSHYGFILVRPDGFVISLILVRDKDLRLRGVSSLQSYYIHASTSADDLYFMTGKYAVSVCSDRAASKMCSSPRVHGTSSATKLTLRANSAYLELLGCSKDAQNKKAHDSKAVCETRFLDNRLHRVLFFREENVEVKSSDGRRRPLTNLDTLRDSHEGRLQHEDSQRGDCSSLHSMKRRRRRITRHMAAPSSEV